MSRSLSNEFMSELKVGCLSPILDVVHNDNTLIMELRGNQVIIYYRGGALFTITKNNNDYQISYNPAYWELKKKYATISEFPSIKDCIKDVALYKDQMDYHLTNGKHTLEKQCQQRIVLENNILGGINKDDPKSKKQSTTGDYFILDIEYAFRKARFDAIALNWPSLSGSRRKRKGLGISFIEIKYNDGAMTGRSGIKKHIADYIEFVGMKEFHDMCRDMEKVFKQKCELGLIPAYTSRLKSNVDDYYNISIDDTKVELIFMFANRDPDSIIAKRELKKAMGKYGKNDTEKIYIATSSDVGYTLFRYAEKGKTDRFIQISRIASNEE